ncbi:unnamed protein product [Rhizopus stolonifer]
MFYIHSGERGSVETKKSRIANELVYANGAQFSISSHILGRKIDILVSIDGNEIACCEWKPPGVSISVAHEQEIKNMRSNSCICNSLLNLPFDTNGFSGNPSVIYMDFIGKTFHLYQLSV